MASDVIDFIASFVILVSLLTFTVVVTTQTLNNALVYQQNQLVSTTVTDTFNTISQSNGAPEDWGQSSLPPTSFGLKWPAGESSTFSPFTPVRLNSTSATQTYPIGTGPSYYNLNGKGTNIYVKVGDTVDYDDVSDLLNLKDEFGWRITYDPLVDVEVSAPPVAPPTNWYDSRWAYRKALTINHVYVKDSLADYPLLVSVTDADLKAYAQVDGDDILFTDSNGVTKLDHEIEQFDSATGTLVAWVRVNPLTPFADKNLYLYWGNAAATSQQNINGVWSAVNLLVTHMVDNPSSSQVADSTSPANNGAKTAADEPKQDPGKLSQGQLFDGVDDKITHALPITDPAQLTLEFWAKNTPQLGSQTILSTGSKSNTAGFIDITRPPSSYDLVFDYAANSNWDPKNIPILDEIDLKCMISTTWGKIYAGSSEGRLYEWNSTNSLWAQKAAPFQPGEGINCLVEYKSNIYAGTSPSGRLLKWSGSAWVSAATPLATETEILSLAVYDAGDGIKIYAGTGPSGKLYKWSEVLGSAWELKAGQLGAETQVKSLAVYGGSLYGGTSPNGELYKWDKVSAWVDVITDWSAHSLVLFNGKIYAGSSRGGLYEYDPDAEEWVQAAASLGSENDITSLISFNGSLFGGTSPNGMLYRWDSVNKVWLQVAGSAGESAIRSLVEHGGKLYGGSSPNGLLLEWDEANSKWISRIGVGIKCLAFYSVTSKVYGGGADGSLQEWDVGNEKWVQAAPPLPSETSILSLAEYGGQLYSGTSPNGKLYRWDSVGKVWVQAADSLEATGISSLAVYSVTGKLYGGTSSGKLFEWGPGPGPWVQAAGSIEATTINSLAEYSGKLYGGTSSGRLFEWGPAPGPWTPAADKLGDETSINALKVFSGKLYGGTTPNGKLYEWDNVGKWVQKAPNVKITSQVLYGGNVYAGTDDGRLLVWDGVSVSWSVAAAQSGTETRVNCLAIFGGQLYAGMGPNTGKLYHYQAGTGWESIINTAPFTEVTSLQDFNGKLYAGTNSASLYSWVSGSSWGSPELTIPGETAITSLTSGLSAKLGTYSFGPHSGSWSNGGNAVSSDDQYASYTPMLTEVRSPTSNVGIGAWTNPTNAYADGGTLATVAVNGNQQTYGYNTGVLVGSITLVRVRLDAYCASANQRIRLDVSTDGGYNWLATTYTTPNLPAGETTYWVDVTGWAAWTPAMVNTIRTKVMAIRTAGTINLDWVPIEVGVNSNPAVTYSPTSNVGGAAWTSPTNAYLDDANRATAAANGRQQIYYGYNYGLSPSSSVTQVRVRLDAFCASANQRIRLDVSTDGGYNWLATTYTTPNLPAGETTYWVDVTGWAAWTPTMVNNIRTKVTSIRTAGTINLDWVPVEVTYIGPQLRSPTANAAGGGGGQWTSPTNAYLDDANRATAALNDRRQVYSGYNYALSLTNSVTQVRVRLDAFCASANQQIKLEVSTDGGTSWLLSTYTTIPSLPAAEATYWVDVTGWAAWTPTMVNNIRTKVTSIRTAGTINLDWVPVEVTAYDAPATHTFNFNDNPAGDTVTKVEVGVEGHTVLDERLSVTVSWDGGTSWATPQTINLPPSDPDSVTYLDFTNATLWTKAMLLTPNNFKVRISSSYQGSVASTVWVDYINTRITSTLNELYVTTAPNTKLYAVTAASPPSPIIVTKYAGETGLPSIQFMNNILYGCTTPSGILVKWDTGSTDPTWSLAANPPPTPTPQIITTTLVNGATIYGGSSPSGLLYRWDGVGAWLLAPAEVNTQFKAETSITSLVLDAGGNLRAGTGVNGLLLGVNTGVWEQKASLPAEYGILSLEARLGKLYAGTDTIGKLLEWDSINLKWIQAAGTISGQRDIVALLNDPANNLYGVTPQGTLLKWDTASAWILPAGASPITSVDSLVSDGTSIYAGTAPKAELYQWNSAANSWTLKLAQPGTETSIKSLSLYNGKIYGGSQGSANLYEWDKVSPTWSAPKGTATGDTSILTLAVLNSRLYAGTNGGKLYEWDGVAWTSKVAAALDSQTEINGLAQLTGTLYAGTGPGGRLFSWTSPAATWTSLTQPNKVGTVNSLAVYNTGTGGDKLYAGTTPRASLYAWNGADEWIRKAARPGAENSILSLAVCNGKLYGGSSPGGLLYEWNKSDAWTYPWPSETSVWGQTTVNALATLSGSPSKLHGATGPNGLLLEWDSLTPSIPWSNKAYFSCIASTVTYNGNAYAGTQYTGKLFMWDGAKWIQKAKAPDDYVDITSLTEYKGELYGGTYTSTGSTAGGRLYWWNQGTSLWEAKTAQLNGQDGISALTSASGIILAGTKDSPGGRLYTWSAGGSAWTQIISSSPGGQNTINSLVVYNNEAYACTGTNGVLYKASGSSWTILANISPANLITLTVYQGKLYAGTSDDGKLYEYDSLANLWTAKSVSIPGAQVKSLTTYNGKLYGAADNGKLYVWDGVEAWIEVAATQSGYTDLRTLVQGGGRLYASAYPPSSLLELSDHGERIVPSFFDGYDGVWTSVAFAVDYSAKSIKVYRNGALYTTLDASSGIVAPSTTNLYVGAYGTKGNYYKGSLDEVRVSDALRSAAWISATYTNQATPSSFYRIFPIDSTSGLKLKVKVTGPGGVLPQAALDINFFYTDSHVGGVPVVTQHPLISTVTDDSGEAIINYPSLDPSVTYFAIVRARQSSLFGVGYATSDRTNNPSSTSGAWTNPTNAYLKGTPVLYASTTTNGAQQVYSGYGYKLSAEEKIDQIQIRLDAYASAAGQQIKVEVSGDGGASWYASGTTSVTTNPTTYYFDVTNQWYPGVWTPSMVNGNNLQVRVTYMQSGSETLYLDWAPVEIRVKQKGLSTPVAPFVTDYTSGVITLVHRNTLDSEYPSDNLHYCAKMVLPVGYSEYREADLTDRTDPLNPVPPTGPLTPSATGTLKLSSLRGESGAILIFTRNDVTGAYDVTVTPWGLCLGQKVVFGETPLDATNVSAKERVVMVNRYTYLVKIEMWKKGGR